jgi:lipopolysaccharide export system protein LptA
MTARANKIVYTLRTDLIVMTGGVVVNQPRGNLRGEMIKYDLTTGRLDGGGGGGRVSMRILPKSAPKPAGDN